MAVFAFSDDTLFEGAVRKALGKPVEVISDGDVRSITELWYSADVSPSNLLRLSSNTFVHLVASGSKGAMLDGVILDVVSINGQVPRGIEGLCCRQSIHNWWPGEVFPWAPN